MTETKHHSDGSVTRSITLAPPDVFRAENGWVLREYDIARDRFVWKIATTQAELKLYLEQWADDAGDGLRRLAERKINEAAE